LASSNWKLEISLGGKRIYKCSLTLDFVNVNNLRYKSYANVTRLSSHELVLPERVRVCHQ
jgi:hypothetical protein